MAAPKPLPSQDYLKSIFDYDDLTGNLIWKERTNKSSFNTIFAGKVAGTIRQHGYIVVMLNNSSVSAHRIIWKIVTGNDPIGIVDHINHNRADNRFDNLRDVTHMINGQHKTKSKVNTSGKTGVYLEEGRWRAIFKIRGNKIHLGSFENKDDAIKARLEAETADWSHLETKVVVKKELTYDYLNENYYYDDGNLMSVFLNRPLRGLSELGYFRVKIHGKTYLNHRLIYWLCTGIKPPKDMVVDHINGDIVDNCIENLRLITKAENNRNTAISKNNKSGVTGVTQFNNSKWFAKICCDRNEINLGYFDTKEEAIVARKEAEIKYFGEFARQ